MMLEFLLLTVGLSCFLLGKVYGVYLDRKHRHFADRLARLQVCATQMEEISDRIIQTLEQAIEDDRLEFLANLLVRPLNDERIQ